MTKDELINKWFKDIPISSYLLSDIDDVIKNSIDNVLENKKNVNMKLYLVTLRGLTTSYTSSPQYGISYVVAENTDDAYNKVKKYLDDNNIGVSSDRELKSIELIADTYRFNNIGRILYL